MPDIKGQPLPPLPKEAFDGTSYETPIARDTPIPKCPTQHKNVTYNDMKKEVRCDCGAAWSGPDVYRLYVLLKQQ